MTLLRPLLAALAMVVVVFAGCLDAGNQATKPTLTPGTDVVDRDAIYAKVKAALLGVPCTATVGTGTSLNLKDLVKVSPAKGGTQSLDIHGNILVANQGGGFFVANISDPLNPQKLGTYPRGGGDIKISPDNMTVIIGNSTGVDLVDIRNPEDPVKVGHWAFDEAGRYPTGPAGYPEQNPHMFYTAKIAGEQWVFIAPNSNTGVWMLKLQGPPEARTLKFVAQSLPFEGGPLGPHDMWVNFDPLLKKWLLYSADGYHGWTVFDVSDPSKPTLAGGLERPESGYTHTIQAGIIGGKRILATIAEVGYNLLEVYDATNLRAPILLATWHVAESNPQNPQPAAPQHEFNIIGGKLYLGHYSNGFYVFDLTKVTTPVAGTADLKPIAHYAVGTPGPADLFTDVWSVDVKDGVLYASSMKDGVHIVGFGCNTPGDASLTSTG